MSWVVIMEESEYFTTDTGSVGSEIDPSEFETTEQQAGTEPEFDWKTPVTYLLLFLALVVLFAVAVGWFGMEVPLPP